MAVHAIILAGGTGKRLWPVSTKDIPKQLLSITDNEPLLLQTMARLTGIRALTKQWILTTAALRPILEQYIPAHEATCFIQEPCGRNTGAAIALAVWTLYQQDPEALLVFTPADHFIPKAENAAFAVLLEQSLAWSREKKALCLLGAWPTKPATCYGYIEYRPSEKQGLHPVVLFHEKPTLSVATYYLNHEHMLWNMGIVCGPVKVFMQELQTHAFAVWSAVEGYMAGKQSYETIPIVPFDTAVLEKSSCVWVLPVSTTWYDVGSLDVFLALKQQYAQPSPQVIAIDAHHNYVQANNTTVVLAHVDDLCIVQHDTVLFITKREKIGTLPVIVDQLKKTHRHLVE